MYAIYAGELLVGHSALDGGDAPMGVASGVFEPTSLFFELAAKEAQADEASCRPAPDIRVWKGLSAMTPAGVLLECQATSVIGYCPDGANWELEVNVLGIPYPNYENLFPEQLMAYRNAFPPSPPKQPWWRFWR